MGRKVPRTLPLAPSQFLPDEQPIRSRFGGINAGIQGLVQATFAFTGAMAAWVEAPFVDIEVIDIFLTPTDDSKLRSLEAQPSIGPALRFIYPYDEGVFMYARKVGNALVVSEVQAYIDLYSRGGRDLKQAEVLLQAKAGQWLAGDARSPSEQR